MAHFEFLSPLRKLAASFQASRDKWKAKCQRAKYELKLLKRRFENLQIGCDRLRQCYQQAETQREQLQMRSEHLQAQIDALEKKGALIR